MWNFFSIEICAISKISKKEIGRCFKLILKALETSVHLITTTDFMVSEISFTFYLVTLNKTKRQEGLKFKGILPVLFLEFSLEFLLLSLLVIKECKKPWSWLSKKEILKWENVWERPVFSVSMVWVIKHRADSINATFLLSRIYKKNATKLCVLYHHDVWKRSRCLKRSFNSAAYPSFRPKFSFSLVILFVF